MERDDPFPGRLDEPFAELDGLGQDDLLLGRQQGDLADLLEVHPERVVDPDRVRGKRLQLLRRRLLERLRVEPSRGVHRGGPRRGTGRPLRGEFRLLHLDAGPARSRGEKVLNELSVMRVAGHEDGRLH